MSGAASGGIPAGDGLVGKVAIVTGAGALDDGIGNGRAAAVLLAASGAKVLCVDRDAALAARTVEMIREAGGEATGCTADVTKANDCERMVEMAVARWGRLDILDNNVGIGSRGNIVEEDPARWRHVMEVNVDSMFLASRAAIPAMRGRALSRGARGGTPRKQAGGGAIVNVSSISALRPRGLTAYSVSKSAVIGLTRAMAVDHGPDGIRVNCVAPGPVYTPMVYGRGMSEDARTQRARASVLGIEGTGWDIGHAVRFLASDQARYITGQVLVVDGGATLRGPSRDVR